MSLIALGAIVWGAALLIGAGLAGGAYILATTLKNSSQDFLAQFHGEATATVAALENLDSTLGAVNVTMGGIYDMTNEDVKYVPLDDYLTEQLLKDAASDFNSSELILESEFE